VYSRCGLSTPKHHLAQAWHGLDDGPCRRELFVPKRSGRLGAKRQFVQCKCMLSWTHRLLAFNSMLGFPGEGPSTLRIVSLNVTGYINVKDAMKQLCTSHDVVCLQETKHSRMHVASLQTTASGLGFKLHHQACNFTSKGGRSCGVIILWKAHLRCLALSDHTHKMHIQADG
jgi:hypothetical protein